MSAIEVALAVVESRCDWYAEAESDLDLRGSTTDDTIRRIEALASHRQLEAAKAWLETEAFHVGATVRGVFEGLDVFDHFDDAESDAQRWASTERCTVEIRQNGQVVHVARPAAGAA